MKYSKSLLVAPAIVFSLGAGLIATAPGAYASSGEELFRGVAATESEAHREALDYLIRHEEKNFQECHQVSYRSYLHPDEPSTRLSGLWDYSITASCEDREDLVLDNLEKGTIGLFPSGEQTVLRLVAEPVVSGDGVYFAYSTTREENVRLITGMDIPVFSVKNWDSVAIGFPPEGEMTEIRYGNPDSPEKAQTVGSARYVSEH
ncbi:hypothetical protein [Streptomyces sp. NPDC001774]